MRHTILLATIVILLGATCGTAQDMPSGASAQLGVHRLRVAGQIEATRLSPDGSRLIIVYSKGNGAIAASFDVATGFERERIKMNRGDHVVIARDKPLILISNGKGLELWDLELGKRVWNYQATEGHSLVQVAISANGERVAALASGKNNRSSVLMWNEVKPGAEPVVGTGHDRCYQIVMPGDGAKVFAISHPQSYSDGKKNWKEDGALTVWETKTGKKLMQRQVDGYSLVVSPDGKQIGEVIDPFITVVDLDNAERKILVPLQSALFAFLPGGKQLLINSREGKMVQWDLDRNVEVRTLQGRVYGNYGSPTSSADGTHAVVVNERASDYSSVLVWKLADGKQVRYSTGHPSTVNGLAYSPDGKRLASCSDDILLIHDPANGKELRRWSAHLSSIEQIAYSPDGKLLASASVDGTVALWDPATGNEVKRLKASDSVKSIAFSRDGALLTSVTAKGSIQTWDVLKGSVTRTIPWGDVAGPQLSPGAQFAFNFGGRSGVSRFYEFDSGIHWFNLRTGKHMTPLHIRPPTDDTNRYEGTILHEMCFSPDGKLFATADCLQTHSIRLVLSDHTVRVWETASRREVMRFDNLPASTPLVAISPDNRVLAHGIGQSFGWGRGTANSALLLRDMSSAQPTPLFKDEKDKNAPRDWLKELRTIRGHLGTITSLTFSPDGQFLATGGSDSVIYVWPVKDYFKRPEFTVAKDDIGVYWPILAESDASKAYRAIAQLEHRPAEAVALLRKHLRPVPTTNDKKIAQHIHELSNESFAVRQRAFESLEKIGEHAPHLFVEALKSPANLETKRRLEILLEKLDNPLGDMNQLRIYRSLVLLERIDTKESRHLLDELAQGAPSAWLTLEARHSAKRSKVER